MHPLFIEGSTIATKWEKITQKKKKKKKPMKGNINAMTCCMAKAPILMLYVYFPVASSSEKARL